MTRKSSFLTWNNELRAFTLLAALVCLLAARVDAADLPEWLEAARRTNLGEFGKGAAAVIIEQRTEFTVDATGKFTSKERAAL
jgi:hypothetical protein